MTNLMEMAKLSILYLLHGTLLTLFGIACVFLYCALLPFEERP